jgi:peptidoglycan/xylan/chitin deacetylase (PgdA/CDA1 family)
MGTPFMSVDTMKPAYIEQHNTIPFFKRIGSYLYVLIILGVALPALVYLAIMQSLGWQVPVLGANGAFSDAAPAGNTIILYATPSTKNYFAGIGGNYDVLLTPWRNYFLNRKLDFKEFQDISQLRKQKNGVLILPSAVALNEAERAEMAAFRDRGGAILATWATGTRNGKGDWEGWQFLDALGVKYLGEVSTDGDVNNLILTGESPVSNTHPSGQRIFMSKTSEKLLRVKGEAVAGRFMNWARTTDEGRRGEGAIIFSEVAANTGRTAFFAFAESAWESHPLATYNLIDDTLQWLKREPAIVRAAWPNGKLSAQVVEMDTEQEFSNALPFASMMQSMGYPATFYVLTSVGKLFPDVLTKLARDFEIGFHGDVHLSFKGQPANQQEKRIQAMRLEMASVIPNLKDMTGFRAPTEGYDGTTEQLLQKFGFRHHTADPNRTEGRLPVLAKLEGVEAKDSVVILPRTQRDDINLYGEKLSVEQTTKALIDDTDQAIDTGALGLLSIHSQNFNADGVLIKAFPGFLEHLKQRRDPLWIASAGQVADWWRERERLKLSSNYTGKRLEFNITVAGEKPLNGAGLIVMLPQKGILPTVQTLKIGTSKPSVSKIDDYRAVITLGALNPGNYAYQVTFAQ